MSDKNSVSSFDLKNLRGLIETKKSRSEIAAALGCDVSTITKHYNGSRDVTSEYVLKYAKYFNVSTDYIFGLTDYTTALDSEDGKIIRMICDYTGLDENSLSTLKKAWEHDNKEHHLRGDAFSILGSDVLSIINTFLSNYESLINIADTVSNWDIEIFGIMECVQNFIYKYCDKIILKEDVQEATERYFEIREYYRKAQFEKYCFLKSIDSIFDSYMDIYIQGFDNLKISVDTVYNWFEKAAELGVKIRDIVPEFPFFEEGENNGED